MTTEEFSNEFDILINSNSISKPEGIGSTPFEFDEYEKSIFLTLAQENLVRSLYNGNLLGDSFEKTEEVRRYLSDLVKTDICQEVTGHGLTENSYFFELPDDVWFITYEHVKSENTKLGCAKSSIMEVVPITLDELHKINKNPFRKSSKKRVLRLDTADSSVELISELRIDEYLIRYITKPSPIILVNLPEGLKINEENKLTECKLNPAIHRLLLEMAVNLALKSRSKAGK